MTPIVFDYYALHDELAKLEGQPPVAELNEEAMFQALVGLNEAMGSYYFQTRLVYLDEPAHCYFYRNWPDSGDCNE